MIMMKDNTKLILILHINKKCIKININTRCVKIVNINEANIFIGH